MNPDRGVSFADLLALGPGLQRTAGLAAWFQGLYGKGSDVPVLVGGAAVELYTGGAYVTGDLDFVGSVPTSVARALRSAGFLKKGRHWIHEEAHILIELPGKELDAGSRTAKIRVGGCAVIALSPEDVLVDRLAAWKLWRSSVDGVNAFLLWRARRGALEGSRLRDLAAAREVSDALAGLLAFASKVGRREPSPEELERWSRRGP